jgi:integrase
MLWTMVKSFHWAFTLRCPRSDIRTIQELPGHADVRITMIYTHVVNRGPLGPAGARRAAPPWSGRARPFTRR